MKCKICAAESSLYDSATILNKYNVQYFRCPHCGFIQTEEPYWLPEVYSSAITSSDIGLIYRNIILSKKLDALFGLYFKDAKTFLDYGAGYGMFVRMMRDKGYDFEWYDKYSENLFAQTHESARGYGGYDIVTSFEMLEHLPNPLETFDKIFKYGDTAIFSTEIVPDNQPRVKEWWYFGLEHGQHIAFYTEKSMQIIAEKFNKHYYHVLGLHIFSDRLRDISIFKIRLCLKFPKLAGIIGRKRQSLLGDDYMKITGISLS